MTDVRRDNPFLSAWKLLHQPRSITAFHMLAYLVVGLGGVTALLNPPNSIQGELGPFLAYAWALGLTFGGLLGLISVPRGLWWIERPALIILGTGAVFYLITVLALQLSSTQGGNRYPQAAILIYVLCHIAIRWLRIRYAALDPTK